MLGRVGVALLVSAALAACAGSRPAQDPYAARRALESTPERPAASGPEDRTYRSSAEGSPSLGTAGVLPPEIRGLDLGSPELSAFAERLGRTLAEAARQALVPTKRFARVELERDLVGGPPAQVRLRTQVLAHVATAGGTVTRDPAFGDPRSKLIAVFSLEDARTGAVLLRYTTWAVAHWEYGPWAMDELVGLAPGLAAELGQAVAGR